MEVVLPEAPPQLFLAWTAFTVAAEQKIRDRAPLLARASRSGFVTTPAAHLAHATVFGPLTEQSERALRDAAPTVAPVLAGSEHDLAESLDYLQRWGEWIVDAAEEAALSLPAPEVAAIRTAALRAIRDRLDHGS
jgi:hypothetical protein